ncbi:MAG: helix-turn-helix transcriptional regulator [Treponema sp.]|nr:helix-turn-helix transcriptional regulator [Spirochaetales bacterium]MDY5811644.1 helix-turn-helix transcriptional regulator [Treponema sp.]
MNTFRENLRDELDFQGLTVKELSARTGIIKGSLDNYLGVRASIPPADVAVKIARALNVSVEYLVTGERQKTAAHIEKNYNITDEFNEIPDKFKIIIKALIKETADLVKR